MRCLFMLKLKGVTLSAFYCNTGSLSKDGFERWTTGSESLCLLICLDASKLVLLSVFTLIETNCSKICLKSPLKSAKSPFPKVDMRRSKDSNHDSDGNRNIKTTTLRVLEQAFSNISLGHSVRTTTTGNSFMRRFMEVLRSQTYHETGGVGQGWACQQDITCLTGLDQNHSLQRMDDKVHEMSFGCNNSFDKLFYRAIEFLRNLTLKNYF